jgi:DNA repair photolyase
MRAPPEQASVARRARLVARGAADNPANRFETIGYVEEPDDPDLGRADDAGKRPLATTLYRDPTRTLLAHNQSPDVGFDTSLNPYRGCEHGCTYCYARPMHEYLGLSAGLDFETKILVKERAPELLRKALSSPRWQPRPIGVGAATDPYQPAERRLEITRRCLEVFAEFRNPVGLVTKGALVARDADLLGELAVHDAALVHVSITTLDDSLRRVMEPRASSPKRRLQAVEALAEAGVPVGVLMAPIVPGLTEPEIPAIVQAAADAGARSVKPIVLRLPHGVKGLFEDWLERHLPERKAKVLSRVRALRDGRLDDPSFHTRHRGSGVFAEQIQQLFDVATRRAGLPGLPELSASAFRRPGSPQLSLF